MTSSRDPEGRRRALLAATVEVVAEVGVARTTHRAIAARAGVPLGATTYYFPTLNDLIAGALEQAGDAWDADLERWESQLRAAQAEIGEGDHAAKKLSDVLTQLILGYLADQPRARLECELYLAAGHTPELRPLATRWLMGLREVTGRLTDKNTGYALATLVDGVFLQATVTGEAPPAEPLRAAIERLWVTS
ncbi:TetR family transcriptional regulator [Kineosporia sp. NBRC 101731]|uniref:TetR/AcrR family transcriptional regulator n=1 Tax=Kineosporia sp. NBRC 101731 TaxID=3032199 RepID=UPI0024A39585|nr:TetR family transcriptional regulator [Kineosporia sp. NBRC 101731]GLY26838.1 TetR family transcriptional regulator [Kineosporia sp. NBRC 101731]